MVSLSLVKLSPLEGAGDAETFLLFLQNIGTHLSINETCLSYDELYTIVTNKAAKGKKGTLVAIIKDTSSDGVIEHLKKISLSKRKKVKEVTLDMANNDSSLKLG